MNTTVLIEHELKRSAKLELLGRNRAAQVSPGNTFLLTAIEWRSI